jgi:putative ABC transport system permease protein
MNYQYIEEKMPQQNYDIWLKKASGISDQMVQTELIEHQLEAIQVSYTAQKLIDVRANPTLQGTNGVLTMCFIVTMFITVIGYLIFWIISMKSRALSFGIFRAMGMTMNQVTGIIIAEQVLMTGSAIGYGFGLGILASKLFVPLLEYVDGLISLPPFIVVLEQNDYFRTLGIALGMLSVGISILFVIVRRLKMNQVIKLGED